jgi:hypothetical protein
MTNKAKHTVNVATAALKLAYAPGMKVETLYTMLRAEQQHQFPDDMTEFYIDSLKAAITLLEQPMFD